jgi:hypothetical protein
VVALRARRRAHAVDVRAQHPVGELDHRVAEVDDCVAGQWLDVAPLGVRARGQHLQAAEAVEQHCHAAEVGVHAERGAAVVSGLRRGFDEADLVAGGPAEAVEGGEGLGGQVRCSLRSSRTRVTIECAEMMKNLRRVRDWDITAGAGRGEEIPRMSSLETCGGH